MQFPANPALNEETQPAGSPYTYKWDGTVWTVLGGNAAISGGLAAAQGGGGGVTAFGGFSPVQEVDLSTAGNYAQFALSAGSDYEFQFMGMRPVVNDYRLDVQFSADNGSTWSDQSNQYGFQITGNQSNAGPDYFGFVRWEGNPGRGFIGAEQDSGTGNPPSRVTVYIQSHDVPAIQTIAYGTGTSYSSTATPFLIYTYYTRLLAERLDNAVRFGYVDAAGTRSAFQEGLVRAYRRIR